MKNYQNTLYFFLLVFIMSCTVNKNFNTKYSNTNLGKYLAASYSVQNGDSAFASSILTNNIDYSKDTKLVELAFFSKIINGEFETAKKLKENYPNLLDKSSFSLIPEIAIYLKNQNYKKASQLINISSDLPGFKNLNQKIDNIILVLSSPKKGELKDIFNQIDNQDIYDLLIFENIFEISESKFFDNLSKKYQTEINNFLISGYLFRKELFQKKNYLIDKLHHDFDKKNIYLNFNSEENIFKNKPSFLLLISSYLTEIALRNSQNKNIPSSYLKMLLEMSNYIYPRLEFSNYYLAKIFTQENNTELAVKKLELISDNSFAYLPSLLNKYKIYNKINQKKSKAILDVMLEKFSDNTSVQYELADYYRKTQQCSKAIDIYNKILKVEKDNYRFKFYKASCLEKLNLWEESKKVFNDIISNNKDPYALNYLSYSMTIRNENLDLALQLINEALKKEPNNGYFLDTLGWVQYKRKEYKLAVKNLQRAVSIQPNSSEIMDHLGDCYYKMGRKKEAFYEWNRALVFDADDNLKQKIKEKIKLYETN